MSIQARQSFLTRARTPRESEAEEHGLDSGPLAMENENRDCAERPQAEWGSLTGWEVIVFQLDDEQTNPIF